ncbi:MAG: hypothetical protein ACK4N4_10950 [Burkholderiales bacterium]
MAALSLCSNPSLAAEPLGRLFFTPAQRTQLDAARSQKNRALAAGARLEEAAPLPEILTYGGVVRRSDGKSTVWLNSHAVHDHQTTADVARVRPDGALTLHVPQTGRRVELKVGQSMEIVSGIIEEPYARRVTVPRPKPAPSDKTGPATPPAEERTAEATSNTTSTGSGTKKDPLESRAEAALERLRSMRKEPDSNGQDSR